MIRANFISAKGAWQAKPADSILLEFQARQAQHGVMKTTNGLEFLVDLPQTVMLRGGDALVLEDGRLIEIVAAAEQLSEIRVGEPRDLARLTYHLGNLHVPVQILANRLRIREDHRLEELGRALGGKIAHIEAPFDPEGGAYSGPAVEEGHVHGPDCGHDHHDHAGHDHTAHDHSAHDHAGHDHGHHDHSSHDHSAHDHSAYDHGHKHS